MKCNTHDSSSNTHTHTQTLNRSLTHTFRHTANTHHHLWHKHMNRVYFQCRILCRYFFFNFVSHWKCRFYIYRAMRCARFNMCVCVCVCIYDQIKIIHIIQVNNSNKYLVSIFIWSASLKSCVLMLLLLPLLFTLASAHLQLQIYTQHPWKVFNRKYCHCNMWVHVFMPQTLNSSMV